MAPEEKGTPPVTTDDPDEKPSKIVIEARIIWQAIGAILITLILLWALNKARGIVSMVAISFFFSLAMEPAVRKLTARYGWRRGSAVGVIYLAALVFVVVMVGILIPTIVELAKTIGANGQEWLSNISEFADDNFGVEVPSDSSAESLAEGTESAVSGWAEDPFGAVVGIASSGINLVFSVATIAMFTFYFSADAPRVQRAVLKLFSPATQMRIGWTWDQAIVQTGGYFYSRMILFIINSLGFFFTMVAVGVPTAVSASLAIFGGFVSVFIPAVGTYIGAAVPILVTLAIQGFTSALIVLAYALIYQQIENYFLSPKISSETMTLNGGVAFGAALAGGAIAGPMGAFTALPVAALITSFISNYYAGYEVVYVPEDEPSSSVRKRRKEEAGDAA